MTWAAITLTDPVADAATLSQRLTVVSVTPWTHGAREGFGHHTWLAFPNAVEALSARLGAPAAVFAVAVSARSYDALAGQIGQLYAVLPLWQLRQWQRHAENLVSLEADKMLLVDPVPVSGGADIRSMPTVAALHEKAVAQAAKADAAALASADPLAELNTFEAAKLAHDAVVDAVLPPLSGGAGWRFYAEADIEAALRSGHPGSDHTITAILAFMGQPSELAYLAEMMP